MRVVILTQYYPPELGAPQGRLSDLARRFLADGHEPIILTAMPNYPTGRIFKGYGGLFRSERIDGIQVLRCWLYPNQGVGFVGRLASYFSFVLTSAVVGAWKLPKADFLLTESPPLFLGLSGYLLSRWKGARWIFNVSDLWPESAVHLGILGEKGWAHRAASWLEGFCYRRSWLVSGQSEEILESIRKRFPGTSTYHLSNGVDPEAFHPARRSPEARRRLIELAGVAEPACVVLYAGLHGVAQGLDQVLESAARLRHRPEIRVLLLGDGPAKRQLQQRAADLGLDGVKFLDAQPRESVPSLLAAADIAIVPLKRRLPGAVPSKIYEAMGAAVPIVLVAGGEPADIVQAARAGVAVAPDDPAGLTAALEALAGDSELRSALGKAGRQAAETRFNRRIIAEKFMRFLGESAC